MNKVVKRILIGLGLFVFLLIAAVVVLFIVIDPNDYRDEISDMAYKATGRKVELKGDIGLKVFPRLSFSLEDVSLGQAEGFGDEPLAHVDDLSLRMALFPLLKKQLKVDAISLDGLTLNLVSDTKGRKNWEVESSSAPASASEPAGSETVKPETPASGEVIPASGDAKEAEQRMDALLQSQISAVNISNCVLTYTDQNTKETLKVLLNKLDLGNVGLNRDITYALDVAAELGKDMQASFAMDGEARYEMADKLVELDVKSFTLSGEAPAILSGRQEIKGKLTGLVNGKKSEASLQAVLESAFLNGDAVLDMNKETGKGNLDIKTKPVVLIKALSAEWQKKLALPAELTADNGPLKSLDVKLAFDAAGNNINVSTAELRLGGDEMVLSAPAIKAVLSDDGALASAEGEVILKGSLRPYLPLAGITPAGKGDELKNIDGGMHFKLAGDNLSISKLKLLIDEQLLALASNRMDVRLAPAGALLPINSLKADLSISAKPRALMNGFGMPVETADPKVLEHFNSSFNLALDNTSLKVSDLKGKLDETDISALLDVLLPGAKGIPQGATSYLKADLQLGSLNLDRYMPPASGKEAPKPEAGKGDEGKKPEGSSSTDAPLRGTPLEKARADISASIKSLTIEKAPLNNIVLKATLANGIFNISQASLQAFEGKFNLSSSLNLVNPQGQNSLKADLGGLNIGSALTSMYDEKRLSGVASANLNLTFKGLDSDSILGSLGGKGNVLVKNGTLRNFQLIPEDAPALFLQHRQSDYHFNDLGGSFTASNGRLLNDDLSYSDKHMSMTGKGSIGLLDRSLDYKGVLKTKETGEIPLHIKGPVNSLKITIDQDALARMAVDKGKDALVKELQKKGTLPAGDTPEERREAINQEINEKVGKELERGLGKLLKQ